MNLNSTPTDRDASLSAAVEHRVTRLLSELAQNQIVVTRQTRLREVDIDSLGLAELGRALEDDFGARVGLAEIDRLDSVSDLIELVDQGAAHRSS